MPRKGKRNRKVTERNGGNSIFGFHDSTYCQQKKFPWCQTCCRMCCCNPITRVFQHNTGYATRSICLSQCVHVFISFSGMSLSTECFVLFPVLRALLLSLFACAVHFFGFLVCIYVRCVVNVIFCLYMRTVAAPHIWLKLSVLLILFALI